LVVQAELDGALSDANSRLTVFAPTNDAFDHISAVLSTLTSDEVKSVLLTHVVDGEVFSKDLVCGSTVKMSSGMSTTTLCGNNEFFQVGAGNIFAPKIVTPNITVCNGVIHAINNVIIPEFPQADQIPINEPVAISRGESNREHVNERSMK
jgi:uncharacterized surface protein with fasciclin (FAS1) repeats